MKLISVGSKVGSWRLTSGHDCCFCCKEIGCQAHWEGCHYHFTTVGATFTTFVYFYSPNSHISMSVKGMFPSLFTKVHSCHWILDIPFSLILVYSVKKGSKWTLPWDQFPFLHLCNKKTSCSVPIIIIIITYYGSFMGVRQFSFTFLMEFMFTPKCPHLILCKTILKEYLVISEHLNKGI